MAPERFFINGHDKLYATLIRKGRELQVLHGDDFARLVAEQLNFKGPARDQFLNIADPKAGRGVDEEGVA